MWFTIVYLLLVLVDASHKPFWFDEFFTLYVSRLPHTGEIWGALVGGTEANPPLNYWLTRGAYALFGVNHCTTRLSAIFGFWLMSVCLFQFVRRRAAVPYAAATMAFPLMTTAYWYAYEARPYGLVLGFSALALVGWQAACECRRRWLALATIGLSLAAAVCSHYYAVFAIGALAVGETARSIRRHRIDPVMWATLAAGLTPLPFLADLIRSANSHVFASPLHSPVFWAKPSVGALLDTYRWLVQPAIPVLLLGFLIWALARAAQPAVTQPEEESGEAYFPVEDIAAAAGFIGIPIGVTVLTALFTGYYMSRYALEAVIGCAILFGFGAVRVLRKPAFGLLLAGLLAGGFVLLQRYPGNGLEFGRNSGSDEDQLLEIAVKTADPIAVANPLLYTQMAYYGTPQLTSQVLYLSEPRVAAQYPDFVPELALRSLRSWAPVRVEDYRSFLAAHPRFWLYYTSKSQLEWLPDQLIKDGFKVTLRARRGQQILFEISKEQPES